MHRSQREATSRHRQALVASFELYLKKNRTLNNVLFPELDKEANPLYFTLDLFYYANQKYNHKKGKPGRLPIAILESLKEWCKHNDVSYLLTNHMKGLALDKVLMFPSANCIKLVCDIFHLEDDIHYVTHVVNCLLSEKKFKVAYHVICALNLEGEFPLESCAFPLFFLGHETYVKAYLEQTPHLQLQFIKILDNLCQKGYALREFIYSLDIECVKPKNMKIDNKWVQKRFPAFIEYFNIDIHECPNLYHARVSGAMAYLFRRRYVEESIDYEPWEEMMFDTVKDHLDIQKALLVKLISANEAPTAFRFADLLKLDRDAWPDAMKHIPYSEPLSPPTRSVHYNSDDYLPFRLDRSDIHLVSTPEKLFEVVDNISENYDMVGLDCEWKPSLGIYKEKTALCQLAVWDSVYLLDILALKEYQSQHQWEYLFRKIFYNEKIMKLSYGGLYDLNILKETIFYEKGNKNYPNEIDLLSFFKKLQTHYPEVAAEVQSSPSSPSDDLKGLSQLCKTVLGKPLLKAEQFSNWENRPLREPQVFYAALDAFCLLMIFEKLHPILKNHKLDFKKVLQTKQTPFKAPKPNTVAQSNPSNTPTSIKDFKVVVDNTIGGITKYLRLLGADVVALDEGDDHMRAVQIAQSQQRIILTTGAAYKKLSGYVPPDMCFCVDNILTAKEQISQIFKHYRVECQDSDIFSRCTMCNENRYIHVQDDQLLSLWTKVIGFDADLTTIGKKNCTVYQCDVSAMDGHLHENVPIQLAAFTPQVFERIRHFLVCAGCGKVYWEGSHLSRVKKSLSRYVEVRNEDKSIYKNLLGELEKECEETVPPEANAASQNSD